MAKNIIKLLILHICANSKMLKYNTVIHVKNKAFIKASLVSLFSSFTDV